MISFQATSVGSPIRNCTRLTRFVWSFSWEARCFVKYMIISFKKPIVWVELYRYRRIIILTTLLACNGSDLRGKSKIWASSWAFSTMLKKITELFDLLTYNLVKRPKSSIIDFMVRRDFLEGLQIEYGHLRRSDDFLPWFHALALYSFIFPRSTSPFILLLNNSSTIIKRCGDSGSPWQTPRLD